MHVGEQAISILVADVVMMDDDEAVRGRSPSHEGRPECAREGLRIRTDMI